MTGRMSPYALPVILDGDPTQWWCSVDPGVAYYAWAMWSGEHLLTFDVSSIGTILELPLCVIEVPRVYREDRAKNVRSDDLIDLAFAAGRIADRCQKHVMVKPADWKGQLPKDVSHKRIKAKMPSDRREALARLKKSDQGHILDAIGIGQWYIGTRS